jgi:hypothetical protein
MRFKTISLIITPLLLANATPDPDVAGIKSVIETFRAAILTKDKSALESLPASENIMFVPAYDADTLAGIRTVRPTVKRSDASSYARFVKGVVTNPAQLEEKFFNIKIHSDGSIATVWFDYSFIENGNVTNWGHESWGLIHTDGGWRISSIVFSITLPPPPKQ